MVNILFIILRHNYILHKKLAILRIDFSIQMYDIKNIENYLFRQVDITEVDKLDNKYIFSFNDCIDIVKDFFNSFHRFPPNFFVFIL